MIDSCIFDSMMMQEAIGQNSQVTSEERRVASWTMISHADPSEGHGHPRRISHKSLAARTCARLIQIVTHIHTHIHKYAVTRTSKIVSSTVGRLHNADVPLNRSRIDSDEGDVSALSELRLQSENT